MNISTYEDIKSIRSYFGYERYDHFEISDFNTILNFLENEIYLIMDISNQITEAEYLKSEEVIQELEDLRVNLSKYLSNDLKNSIIEEMERHKQLHSIYKKHLSHLYKKGKIPLEPYARYLVIKLIEASKKEFNSYEPFRIYMHHSINNHFNLKEKSEKVNLYYDFKESDIDSYYYFPFIKPVPQNSSDWVRSLKQTLSKDLDIKNFDLRKSRSQRTHRTILRKSNEK